MRILIPAADDTISLQMTSGVPLSDYPAWASGTSYTLGQRVHQVVGNLAYDFEAIAAGSGVNPNNDSQLAVPTRWIRIGLSNRYKVVDRIISDTAKGDTGTMTFRFLLAETVTEVALFGLVGNSVTVSVQTPTFGTIEGSTQTRSIVDSPNISNWFDYFFAPIDVTPEILFEGLPGYAGNYLVVTIESAATVEVGEIVFGNSFDLGVTLENPKIGIRDYSRKERDAFGRPEIVERASSYYGDFDVRYASPRTPSILRQMSKIRAKPVVFSVKQISGPGVMIFGYYTGFEVNLEVSDESHATLSVEGLV